MSDFVLFMVFPALIAFAGASDFLTMTITNRLCLAIAAAFFPVAALAGLGAAGIALHAACGLAALALAFALFSAGWIGGGDAKLFAAAALWLGWESIAAYAAATAIAGGALSLLYLALRLLPAGATAYFSAYVRSIGQRDIPYGIALTAAALVLYPHCAWVRGLLTSVS
jgi:prepilin peptidase CpaA